MMEAVGVCYPPMSLIINSFSVMINQNKVLYTQFMIHNYVRMKRLCSWIFLFRGI